MSKETERNQILIERLESENDALHKECRSLEGQNEDLKASVETLTGLLEEAKEHVPAIAVYGIDHRRIEEATRDAIQARPRG